MSKFEYNTGKKKLVLPEYGRNILKMVEYAKTLPTREERNEAVKTIISVIGNLNPHLRDISDFKHKLWDHLAIMSDFELDIDYPYEPPSPQTFQTKPNRVPYNNNDIQYKYYGIIIERFIKRASTIKDEEKRKNLMQSVMNHMKKLYIMWNKEMVNDEDIFEHLRELSEGQLDVIENTRLTESREIVKIKKKHNGRKHR